MLWRRSVHRRMKTFATKDQVETEFEGLTEVLYRKEVRHQDIVVALHDLRTALSYVNQQVEVDSAR